MKNSIKKNASLKATLWCFSCCNKRLEKESSRKEEKNKNKIRNLSEEQLYSSVICKMSQGNTKKEGGKGKEAFHFDFS